MAVHTPHDHVKLSHTVGNFAKVWSAQLSLNFTPVRSLICSREHTSLCWWWGGHAAARSLPAALRCLPTVRVRALSRISASWKKVALVHQAYFDLIFSVISPSSGQKEPVILTSKNILVNISCKSHPKTKQNLYHSCCQKEFCWLNLSSRQGKGEEKPINIPYTKMEKSN